LTRGRRERGEDSGSQSRNRKGKPYKQSKITILLSISRARRNLSSPSRWVNERDDRSFPWRKKTRCVRSHTIRSRSAAQERGEMKTELPTKKKNRRCNLSVWVRKIGKTCHQAQEGKSPAPIREERECPRGGGELAGTGGAF